jgi:glycosyltransferase involved in cell wall biosynthesis
MRLGYDASPIRPQPSGVGRFTACLLDALRVCFPSNSYLVYSHRPGKHFHAPGVITTQRLGFPIKEIWMQLWLPHVVSRTRPDLCHFTNTIAPLRMRAPYVLTVHDLSLIRHPEWHPATRRAWMGRIMRPSILGARRVVCSSEATRRDLLSWLPLDPQRVSTVELAVPDRFRRACSRQEIDSIRTRYGITRPFLLYVGNIEPRKNLLTLIEAFRILNPRGIDLILAGKRAWLTGDFLREAARPDFKGRLRLLNYVPDEHLPALYQAARGFVYPSKMEGFGLPVLEAMACGAPVITSSIEPLASMVGNAGWLANPEKPAEWAEAMGDLIRNSDKGRVLSERARERAAPYTWPATASAMMRCYESAL